MTGQIIKSSHQINVCNNTWDPHLPKNQVTHHTDERDECTQELPCHKNEDHDLSLR